MLNNVRVGPKLIGGFLLVALLCAFVGYRGLAAMTEINEFVKESSSVRVPSLVGLDLMNEGKTAVQAAERWASMAVQDQNDGGYREQLARLEAKWKQVDKGWRIYAPLPQTEEEARVWQEFIPKWDAWKRDHLAVMEALAKGDAVKAEQISDGAAQASFVAAEELLSRLVEIQDEVAKANAVGAASTYDSARTALLGILCIAVLGAVLLGFGLTRSITAPLSRGVGMMQELGKGHLGVRLQMARKDEIGQLAKAMDGFAEDLQTTVVGTLKKIGAGDLTIEVVAKDGQDEIAPALKATIESLRGMTAEAGRLSQAAVEGKLATRADASKYQGDYRKIVEGVNATLDAVIGPLNVAAEYIDRIAKGDIPPKITDSYNGDFNEIKNNLNTCIDAVQALVADAGSLAKAAIEGKLDSRADSTRHQGDFRAIIGGVNRTIDALVGHLDSMPAPAMIIDKDFTVRYMNKAGATVIGLPSNQIVGTKCFQHFRTTDCNTSKCACSQAMQQGRTATSQTAAQPNGQKLDIEYSGVPIKDDTGTVIGAFEVASDLTAVKAAARIAEKQAGYQAEAVDKVIVNLVSLARGDLRVDTELKETDQETRLIGENFAKINKALDDTVTAIQGLTDDASMLAQAAVAGKLSTRADAAKHQGDFQKIVQGVNETLDAVLAPITEAAEVLERVAAKDLSARIMGNYNGDHARIKESLNIAVENLDGGLTQVGVASEQVSSAAGQISSGSQSMAEGASEQASSLEEISSSLEEMASMTKQNADNSDQAKGLAQGARDSAEKGIAAMGRMTGAIDKIKTSSDQTAKIVKTIDEIAFQTNLLALNAAVEAARAGEAGKGFAVVAEEVRNLAQRSAEAAKTTADMIEESVKNAEEGVKVTDEVAATLGEITEGARKVNDLVAEIAAASKEQAQGIEQVNTAVAQLDKVTQQNAANAEESASAAEELNSQSAELQGLLGSFRLTEETRKKPAAAVPVHHLMTEVNHAECAPSAGGKNRRKKEAALAVAKAGRGGNGHQETSPEHLIPLDDDVAIRAF